MLGLSAVRVFVRRSVWQTAGQRWPHPVLVMATYKPSSVHVFVMMTSCSMSSFPQCRCRSYLGGTTQPQPCARWGRTARVGDQLGLLLGPAGGAVQAVRGHQRRVAQALRSLRPCDVITDLSAAAVWHHRYRNARTTCAMAAHRPPGTRPSYATRPQITDDGGRGRARSAAQSWRQRGV